MTKFAGGVNHGGAAHSDLPRSYSVSPSRANVDDDFSELLRAASTRSLGGGVSRVEYEVLLRQQTTGQAAAVAAATATGGRLRSANVGMGKIDEEKDRQGFDEIVDDTPLKGKKNTGKKLVV